MLCQKCQKNPANVKIIKNINGNVMELHLCSDCAASENIKFPSFPADELFSAFFKDFTPQLETDELRCPTCEMTYREFKNLGKFGCSDCFAAFDKYIDAMLKSIHGNIEHVGKLPQRTAAPLKVKREIDDLKYELRKAVEEENFEQAAQLRDRIKALEKGDSTNDK